MQAFPRCSFCSKAWCAGAFLCCLGQSCCTQSRSDVTAGAFPCCTLQLPPAAMTWQASVANTVTLTDSNAWQEKSALKWDKKLEIVAAQETACGCLAQLASPSKQQPSCKPWQVVLAHCCLESFPYYSWHAWYSFRWQWMDLVTSARSSWYWPKHWRRPATSQSTFSRSLGISGCLDACCRVIEQTCVMMKLFRSERGLAWLSNTAKFVY